MTCGPEEDGKEDEPDAGMSKSMVAKVLVLGTKDAGMDEADELGVTELVTSDTKVEAFGDGAED